MAKVTDSVGFWVKTEEACERPVLCLLVCLIFALYSVLCVLSFCCFLFAHLLVLMRQHSTLTKSIDYGQAAWLCHLPAEGPWVSYLISLSLIFLIH